MLVFNVSIFSYVLTIIVYGLSLGSFIYTSKMYLYNSVKAKDFGHVWSMVMASQSMSALAGVMITGMQPSLGSHFVTM